MNIFDQYGIKEVADVTLYSIHKKKDGSGDVYYVPALYLDTLKISSVEKTAENVWAQGGLGNSRLISWDYGKQINVTLEDALCTPASLGLCWGGVLSSDWKDGKVQHDLGITWNKNYVDKISRMEKAFYPRNDKETSTVSYLLPQSEEDRKNTIADGIIRNSMVIDGTNITGFGSVKNHSYKWTMYVESDIQSIAMVPNKFFDITGKSYKIDDTRQLIVNSGLVDNNNDKFTIIYAINPEGDTKDAPVGNLIIDKSVEVETASGTSSLADEDISLSSYVVDYDKNEAIYTPPTQTEDLMELKDAKYLCIVIDKNDDYFAYVSADGKTWHLPAVSVNVTQFKGLDMWLRFSSVNELIYYLITKHENDINYIASASIEGTGPVTLTGEENLESRKLEGKLWSYVNPKTMTPYPDDYWFHQGEPYYIKSLTLAPKHKELKAQKIIVTAGQFPGMYMLVGETYIRSRDTGEDERMQIKFPLCKVKSDQNLTLEAEGDPTVFNLDIEVARPVSGIMMELTAYEVAEKIQIGDNGMVETKDGSTEILSE